MKTFSTSGTGSQQTLSEIETDKIPVYDSVEDVTADLANLSVGQIGTTKDTGSELSAPVDVVQSGNMHAVTSNAVYKAMLKAKYAEESGSLTAGVEGNIDIFFDNTDMTQILGIAVSRILGQNTGLFYSKASPIQEPDNYRTQGYVRLSCTVSVTQNYTIGVTILYK